MANDFAVIHVYVGNDPDAASRVASLYAQHLSAQGYELVAESRLTPYDPRLNLVGQRSRSLYTSPNQAGWVSVVDEDIFRLDEPTAEALLAQLANIGPAILLWSIDQFVWGYSIAANGQLLDRYTEDYIELDAYNPTFLHSANLSLEEHGLRYVGQPAALASFFALLAERGHALSPSSGALVSQNPSALQERANHYISGYRKYYRATADNENTYMDELISGGGQIYADAWAKELAAELGIATPDLRYLALVRDEANGVLPSNWLASSYCRPPLHQPNYSVALTLYCPEPLTASTVAQIFSTVTATLPPVGQQGWSEIEFAGGYYADAAAAMVAMRLHELAEGEHLAARYYPGCNLVLQRRSGDLPHDVVLLEYPSVIDDRFTAEVLAQAPEAASLQELVFSKRLQALATTLFGASKAAYGYISVAGGGVGGDGGGRANGPGAMLADALARPLAQLSSRVAEKEATSWRERWGNLDRNIRGIYWANLLSTSVIKYAASPSFLLSHEDFVSYVVTVSDELVYIQLPASIAAYAEGNADAELEQLRDELLPLLDNNG